MRIYCCAISKGGSGKTATAAEIALGLARAGRRVLAIDLDQQGNLTRRLGVTEAGGVAADVLTGQMGAEDAAEPSPAVPGTDVLAGTHELSTLENHAEVSAALAGYLPRLTQWDAAVIDTPPALNTLTTAGLIAADVVIAPMATTAEAYDQLDRLKTFIQTRLRMSKPGQAIHWVVPTMCEPRRVIDREILELVAERYPGRVTCRIRRAIAVVESYAAGEPVGVYAPTAGVSQDYATAVAQIIKD